MAGAERCQYLIIGAGVVGMAIARALRARDSSADIIILEKEEGAATHASGRNSGVLHSGIYYGADSLKARFCVAGNNAMRGFCKEKGIPLNECGKLVVAVNQAEQEKLYELERRGKANGSEPHIISQVEAERIEPNIRTFGEALWSPFTATTDPRKVSEALKDELTACGIKFVFGAAFLRYENSKVLSSVGEISAEKVINCAGLYADKIAHQFGFGRDYTIIPFKGIYLKYAKNRTDIRTNIYPVPNLKNPFLEVHFTKTVDGTIKIGPTAIPAFWRENYEGLSKFKFEELAPILGWEALLFLTNAFGFRTLAFKEMRKYSRAHLIRTAANLVKEIDPQGFGEFAAPGIRAQLLDKQTHRLVQDFVVQGDSKSVHLLNTVSPGFTSAFPFAEYVVEKYL